MSLFKIATKWMLSFKKSQWDFEDYPIRTWKNPNAGEKKVAYGAGILNWSLMVGHGETPKAAIESLKQNFKLFKNNNPDLPRPGAKVPIKFASTENIGKYEEIAVDFFQKVLDMDYHNGFYSNGSSLAPMMPLEQEEAKRAREIIISRTLSIYNVDITDIYDDSLVTIFERIKNRK